MKGDQGIFKDQPLLTKSQVGQNSSGQNVVIKSGQGYLKSITLSQEDAAPTAGTITVYDGVGGYGANETVLFRHTQTTAVFMPVTIPLEIPFKNGIAVAGIDDVRTTFSFK